MLKYTVWDTPKKNYSQIRPKLTKLHFVTFGQIEILGTADFPFSKAILYLGPKSASEGLVMLPGLRITFFGPRNFATIMGLSQPIMTFGSFLGPVAAGYAYDVQGNYLMVFSIIAAVGMIGAVLVLFIKKPTFKENVGGAR